jgi:sugar phosphate isomerase/epimerase
MIYVSSSCIRANYINESVRKLAEEGFTHIELSGGTKAYPDLEKDLLSLQDKYGLHYLCHNYFPPPEIPFVINIASLDEKIHQLSMENLIKGIELSEKLGAKQFGFHAGFLINIPLEQIGKKLDRSKLFDRKKASEKFIRSYSILRDRFPNMKLYLENNVISNENLNSFKGENPFFICDKEDYENFKEKLDFNILLDIAHLKVSCQSLKRDFKKELEYFLGESDYIHLSDNNSLTDSNGPILEDSEMYRLLSQNSLVNKTLNLEIYRPVEEIRSSMNLIKKLNV